MGPDGGAMAGALDAKYLDRVVDNEVAEALASSPAVLIEGPRGCGKTWTGRRFACSEVVLDGSEAMLLAAEVDPGSILEGPEPRLLDEWQLVRGIWNPMHHVCDRRGGFGRCLAADAGLICRGGWPRMIETAPAVAQARLRGYLDGIARTDISRVAGVRRNPQMARRLLASLARNEAITASHATLRADLTERGASPPARSTLWSYLDELTRLFMIEPLPAWSAHLRSSARLRKTPKRYFADPALAVAALGASPASLTRDLQTMGLLFESMALRDLRVYAQSLDARACYYGDDSNLEADAIIDGLDTSGPPWRSSSAADPPSPRPWSRCAPSAPAWIPPGAASPPVSS